VFRVPEPALPAVSDILDELSRVTWWVSARDTERLRDLNERLPALIRVLRTLRPKGSRWAVCSVGASVSRLVMFADEAHQRVQTVVSVTRERQTPRSGRGGGPYSPLLQNFELVRRLHETISTACTNRAIVVQSVTVDAFDLTARILEWWGRDGAVLTAVEQASHPTRASSSRLPWIHQVRRRSRIITAETKETIKSDWWFYAGFEYVPCSEIDGTPDPDCIPDAAHTWSPPVRCRRARTAVVDLLRKHRPPPSRT